MHGRARRTATLVIAALVGALTLGACSSSPSTSPGPARRPRRRHRRRRRHPRPPSPQRSSPTALRQASSRGTTRSPTSTSRVLTRPGPVQHRADIDRPGHLPGRLWLRAPRCQRLAGHGNWHRRCRLPADAAHQRLGGDLCHGAPGGAQRLREELPGLRATAAVVSPRARPGRARHRRTRRPVPRPGRRGTGPGATS